MQQSLPYQLSPKARPQHRTIQLSRHAWQWFALPLSLIAILLLWETIVVVGGYQAFILPSPSLVASRFIDALGQGFAPNSLLSHSRTTLTAALSGFGIALAISLVLGYILAKVPLLERVFAPILAATQAVPIVALAPLIILWVGADLRSKILVAALVTFFPILSSTIVALRGVPKELREMAQISGANSWQTLIAIEAPLALPVFFGGFKAGLALATTGAVVGEFVAGREGLGALINIARGLFDTPLMFVALLMLAISTLLLYLVATLLERLLIRWEPTN